MRNRNNATGLASSPILVGAVTCLVTVTAVFLSYNANKGLPFVPTYDIQVQVPDAAGLVNGNEVRIGGKRVGVIDKITGGEAHGQAIATLDLKLDKIAEPIHREAKITVRPRSPLGLKYLELVPVKRGPVVAPGGKLPLTAAGDVVDLDKVLGAFDQATRRSLQLGVTGLGTGFAGRGADFNAFLASAPPLVQGIDRVAANLADPRTDLRGALRGTQRTTRELAPVTRETGSLVRGADTTAGALASVRPELEQTIEGLPPTEALGTRVLPAVTPVLRDARVLLRDLRPGTRVLAQATRDLDGAIDTGIPVVRRALDLSDRLNSTLIAVDDLASDPLTINALDRLLPVVRSALPTLRFVVPMQTTCNYIALWMRNVASSISEGDNGGTWFRTLVVAGTDEFTAHAEPDANLHVNPYGNSAAPGQVRECEPGNEPYLPGQRIGNVPGNQGTATEDTAPPAGVGP